MRECGDVHQSGATCTLLKHHAGAHQAYRLNALIEWENVK